jgi:hypothetical protein
MKMLISTLLFGLVAFLSVVAVLPSSESRATDEHTEWIAKSLREIESIKVGMMRADLLSVFNQEGGISTRTRRRYAYRDCPYIKVDVEFEVARELESKVGQNPKDKIGYRITSLVTRSIT